MEIRRPSHGNARAPLLGASFQGLADTEADLEFVREIITKVRAEHASATPLGDVL